MPSSTSCTTPDKAEWNRRIADSGYLVPHWPRRGDATRRRSSSSSIDEEFARARVRRPHLAVGAWALPTIIVHGTDEQQERWVPPTLRGEITWCQMFSEPGAGSDLASLATKAARVDGGWLLTGQKVWTSMAHFADLGHLPRPHRPDGAAARGHRLLPRRHAAPGIDVRPLRELTGAEMFNEVFLSDVFVPDDCVVGAPTRRVAGRPHHARQRAGVDGSGLVDGPGRRGPRSSSCLEGRADDPLVADTLGARGRRLARAGAMGVRMTLRALDGAAPGPESSIRKLLGVELDQRGAGGGPRAAGRQRSRR